MNYHFEFADSSRSLHCWRDSIILFPSYSTASPSFNISSTCGFNTIHFPDQTRFFCSSFFVSILSSESTEWVAVYICCRLFAGIWILILGGFLQLFFQSTIFEIGLSLGGAFIFSLFIIFDTQMMMTTLSAEEYILATINLYMDIINLFLYILRILDAINRQ